MTENLTRGVERSERPRSSAWLWPLLPIAVATFALSALVAYQLHGDNRQAQSFLQRIVIGIYAFAGFVPSFFFFLLMLSWSSIWFLTGKIERPIQRVLRLAGLTLALAIWVNLQPDGAEASPAAGQLGSWLGGRMVSLFGHFLSVVLVAPLTLGALLLATDFFFYRFFEGMHARLDQMGPQSSDGVEAQVTEHLKGLSQVIAQPVVESEAAMQAASSVDTVVGEEDAEEPVVLRRMSSFERRQLATTSTGQDDESAFVVEDASAPESEAPGHSSWQSAEPRLADARDTRSESNQFATASDAAAGAESAEQVTPHATPKVRRGRLAPIVAGETEETAEDVESASAEATAPAFAVTAESSDAEPPAETSDGTLDASSAEDPVRAHSHAEDREDSDDEGAQFGADDLRDGDVAAEASEAPADEWLLVETSAEVAPPQEPIQEPLQVTLQEPLQDPQQETRQVADASSSAPVEVVAVRSGGSGAAVPAAEDDDADYFAADADEPPEVEPVIELPSQHVARSTYQEPSAANEVNPAAEAQVETTPAEPASAASEPVIAIPRPPEGVRQQRLFVGMVDDSLVRDAIDVVTSSRRASATHLQRKLRVDYGQAIELLQVLAHRGVIDLVEGESQGRVR